MRQLIRTFLLFCFCAFATASAKQTVCAAELGTVSGGDALLFTASANSGGDIMPYASYDTYYGSISSTYLEYMRGYLAKLPPTAHYVGARVGQYDYLFAYGDDLIFDGSTFSGDVAVIRWNTYNNGTISMSHDSGFSLTVGAYLVYTDLSDKYPSLATSSDFTLRQILILLTIFCLCLTIDHMYQVRKIRRVNRRENE